MAPPRLLLPALLPLLLLLAPLPARATAPPILVYVPEYLQPDAGDELATLGSQVSFASFDYYSTTTTGKLVGNDPPAGQIAAAKAAGAKTFATISNFGASDFDPKIGHVVLASKKPRTALLAALNATLDRTGLDGVNVDIESIKKTDRKAYTAFVTSLIAAIGGRPVVLSIPAVTFDNPKDSWSGAFDYPSLGRMAGVIFQVMTYDENGPWGAPGPVSSLPWFTQCADYAVSVMPSARVSLGLPAYGYCWDLTKGPNGGVGESVNWRDIPERISTAGATPKWDAASSSPYFEYTDSTSGHKFVCWYENADSIKAKVAVAKARGTGVSVWALGESDASFWAAVNSA